MSTWVSAAEATAPLDFHTWHIRGLKVLFFCHFFAIFRYFFCSPLLPWKFFCRRPCMSMYKICSSAAIQLLVV